MLKSIQLKFAKIKYSGDSIGRDIRIEIEALGKFMRVDKRIKVGTTAEINQEIGRFETNRRSFQIDVTVTVIEKDLLFNDMGNIKSNIKINIADNQKQQFVFEVQIKECRSIFGKFWGNRIAIFEIILQAEVLGGVKYTAETDDGWLKVILEDKHAEESLPEHLKVKLERADAKREYFTILEGHYRGRLASVALKKDGSSYLISGIKHEQMVLATYSISKKIFILKGKKYRANNDTKNPWKKGLYDIEIPDCPHRGGLKYPEAGKGTVWFRIGHNGKRYLHPGRVSEGCISIVETVRWMEIYNMLIKRRKGDFMSVGLLEVID